jgi:hypothetical protein
VLAERVGVIEVSRGDAQRVRRKTPVRVVRARNVRREIIGLNQPAADLVGKVLLIDEYGPTAVQISPTRNGFRQR